ncbi:MAG: response regulator transcription factor [Sulfitobacter sp.]
MSPRLLIVDDDPEINSALARGLALHGFDAEAENRADTALERLRREPFSGAIIDVMLGADSGLDLVRNARAAGLRLPILMLSALSEVEHRTAGLEAGADDYIVKPFDFEELVARLQVQLSRAPTRMESATLALDTRLLTQGDIEIALTERECDVLAFLIRAGTSPTSRGQLFDALWAAEGSVSENVVDVYIGYLRKKLLPHDLRFEIKTVRNKGFVLDGQIPTLE